MLKDRDPNRLGVGMMMRDGWRWIVQASVCVTMEFSRGRRCMRAYYEFRGVGFRRRNAIVRLTRYITYGTKLIVDLELHTCR